MHCSGYEDLKLENKNFTFIDRSIKLYHPIKKMSDQLIVQIIFRFMYIPRDPNYQTFLSPAVQRLTRQKSSWLEKETKMIYSYDQAAEENEKIHEAEEKQEKPVYIPGACRLIWLNNRKFYLRFVLF